MASSCVRLHTVTAADVGGRLADVQLLLVQLLLVLLLVVASRSPIIDTQLLAMLVCCSFLPSPTLASLSSSISASLTALSSSPQG